LNYTTTASTASLDQPLKRDLGNPRYRPDIDGLRAVAVLSVLFFHVGFYGFGGGWVGVDVFFVISGFLITRLIRDEIEAGTFSFANFYVRRARRLFASFIFTVAVSFVAGLMIFDRAYLQHFAGEVVYALVAASNFFYWLDGGYFGVAEQYKPLLHTWSLGVEEQFYLIWPLGLVVLLGHFRRCLWPVLTLVTLGSLLLADYFFYWGTERAVFLLLPGRIFEFAIGAIVVWLVGLWQPHQRLLEAAMLLGLAMIGLAVFGFTISTPFPTFYALLPCVGTALAILGGTALNLRWLLGNPLMVGIGKISYSLYLVHWPLIVFYSYHRLAPLGAVEKGAICCGSILAAVLMYAFIEQPFRDPRRVRFPSRAALGFVCTAAIVVLLVPASIVWAKGSLYWRGSAVSVSAEQVRQLAELSKQDEVDDFLRDRVFADTSGRTRLMFLGDSHSGDIAAALYLTLGAVRYDYARLRFDPACIASSERPPWILRLTGAKDPCELQAGNLRSSRSLVEADYVFVAQRWTTDTVANLVKELALLRSLTRARLIVVGQNATFPTFDDSLRFLDTRQLQRLNHVLYQQQSSSDIEINSRLRDLTTAQGLAFLERQSLVCAAALESCEVFAGNGEFFYSDTNHWSYSGRAAFGRRMLPQLETLLATTPVQAAAARP
jgi:peptidoglycan/LPS O-acetylase OafA/YrhL